MMRRAIAAFAVCTAVATTAGCSVLPESVRNAVGDTIRVEADFENIAGMYVGNSVDVLGMPIGRIESITPHGSYITVGMSIDRDIALPADAVAALVSPSVITDRHIELHPPYSGHGPTLTDGAHIPLARTRTPVEIDRLIKELDKFSTELSPEAQGLAGPLSGRVAYPMLNGNGERIRQTLAALSGALKVGVNNKDSVASIIVKLNDLTMMLAENDRQVREFSNRTTRMSSMLADQAPGLRGVLAQLNDFVANTGTMLDQNRDQLPGTLDRLSGVAEQLRRNSRNLTEIVDLAPLMFQNVDNTMTPINGGAIRLHLLTNKSLLDNEMLSLFCERIMMRSDGCRTGKIKDFGPDLGLTAALLGISKKWQPK